jgi:3'-5' exoribonuclease
VEQTVEGGLIGHLSLGFEFLVKKISSIDGFPDDLALHLKHGILSHHGEYEQQSPVLPKTLEATIVYHADSLVSQANAVREVIAQNTGFQKTWSNYIGIKSRKYLLTKPRKG